MVALAAAMFAATPAVAAAPGELSTVVDGATAAASAVPRVPANDLVSVRQRAELSTTVRDRALRAAQRAGVPAVQVREFGVGLRRIRRAGTLVLESTADGWAFPMAVTAMPPEGLVAIVGRQITAAVAGGGVVLSTTSAALHHAQVGDRLELVGFDGALDAFDVALVVPDAAIGGTELLMSTAQADALGATLTTEVVLYGRLDHSAVAAALAAEALSSDHTVRVRTTWDPPDPDAYLGIGALKAALGEFQYDWAHLSGSGNTAVDSAWLAAHVAPARRTFPTGVKARCNLAIEADLTAALQAVADAGLVSLIDLTNTNTYGGCTSGQARFNRIGINIHELSKHSWGGAIDMNTVTNCHGCVPTMDCRIVRIFRAHGFAWGGNSITADGMHFEWVGEPRDQLPYPSRYCPNLVTAKATDAAPPPTTRETLFADGGSLGE